MVLRFALSSVVVLASLLQCSAHYSYAHGRTRAMTSHGVAVHDLPLHHPFSASSASRFPKSVVRDSGPVVNISSVFYEQDNPCAYYVGEATTRNSGEGIAAAAVVMILSIVVALLLTLVNYRKNKWESVEFEKLPLTDSLNFKRNPADFFRMITLFFDFLQVAAMVLTGPYAFNFWGSGTGNGSGLAFNALFTYYPQNLFLYVKVAFKTFLWDFDEIGFWSGDTYNIVFRDIGYFAAFMGLLFFVLCCVFYLQLDRACNACFVGRRFLSSFPLIAATIGDICFIPVMYNLFSTLSCIIERDMQNDPTNQGYVPFLARNCSEQCWTGDHSSQATVAVIAIALYLPYAIYTRPIWQMLPDSLTLKDQPLFIIITINWKLWLVLNESFFQQFPVLHALGFFFLTGAMLFCAVHLRPTTLPYFDLIMLTCIAENFWISVAIVCGLFLPGWITVTVLGVGSALILIEFFLLIVTKLGDAGGKFAVDSKDWHKAREQAADQKLQFIIEKRERLKKVAQHKHELANATNPREVARLKKALKDDLENKTPPEAEPDREPHGGPEEDSVNFQDRITGQPVTIVPVRNKRVAALPSLKVLGLQLATNVPSHTPMAYRFNADRPGAGTLLIMRTPDCSLYHYLQLKLNAYHAYHNALETPPPMQKTDRERQRELEEKAEVIRRQQRKDIEKARKQALELEQVRSRLQASNKSASQIEMVLRKRRNKRSKKEYRKNTASEVKSRSRFLAAIRGPSYNILPEEKEDIQETRIIPFKPVNTTSLLAIIQNTSGDLKSFQVNLIHHATSLRSYISRFKAHPYYLGKEICAIFDVEPYADVVKVEIPDERLTSLKKQIKELEDIKANMEREHASRIKEMMTREYDKGRITGIKLRAGMPSRSAARTTPGSDQDKSRGTRR